MAESEEEVDVLVQRVVKDINNALKRNPHIDEVGLIPCPEARLNRSPIVLVQNKLGVESWCVKLLLPYVHNRLLLHRQRRTWLDREALVDITCTLLLLNPDFTTAWNVRKELLQCGVLSPDKDLYLGKLALTKFPKSPETWIHRRWVLQQVLQQCSPAGPDRKEGGSLGSLGPRGAAPPQPPRPSERLHRTLRDEMRVCADAAGRYPSNYNAWSHRIWVLEHMAKGNLKVLHDELSSMRVWVSMHVSDHSGFHYRQFLLKALVRELGQSLSSPPRGPPAPDPHPAPHPHPQANGEPAAAAAEATPPSEEERPSLAGVPQLFQEEMELSSELIQAYPGHEALWSHRRHVFYLWHHWRRDPTEPPHPHPSPPRALRTPSGGGGGGAEAQNGQARPMEVDGVPDPRDTKRLKRASPPGCGPPSLLPPPSLPPPSLRSEHGFIAAVLDGCLSPEQGRFALAYRKWLDSVIGQ